MGQFTRTCIYEALGCTDIIAGDAERGPAPEESWLRQGEYLPPWGHPRLVSGSAKGFCGGWDCLPPTAAIRKDTQLVCAPMACSVSVGLFVSFFSHSCT